MRCSRATRDGPSTIGVCRNYFFERNQDDVERAVEQAIADLAAAGARTVDFEIPLLEYGLGAIPLGWLADRMRRVPTGSSPAYTIIWVAW